MTTEAQLTDVEYDDEDAGFQAEDELDELYEPYRSVSKAAVCSLVAAVFAITGLLLPALLGSAFLAVVFGIMGLRNLRNYPGELTGKTTAILGIVIGMILLVGGTSMHTYIYLTEVPAGYERISFAQLQTLQDPAMMGGLDLPMDLDGKRVFVKGYVHPGVSDLGEIKRFILVPDMGTCCFGGQPKLTDMIEVTIVGKQGLHYSQRKRRIAGTFHVSPRLKKVAGGLDGGYYELKADYFR